MSNVPVDQFIEETHDNALARQADRRRSGIRTAGLVAFVGVAALGASVFIGKHSPDGSPKTGDIASIEACASSELPTVATRSEVISAINGCAIDAQVTLTDVEMQTIERAVAPATDFAG